MRKIDPVCVLLRSAREAKGYTQREMGDKLGMTANGYGKIELGKNGLPVDQVDKICRILGISTLDLLRAQVGVDDVPPDIFDRHAFHRDDTCYPRRRSAYTRDEWTMHALIASFVGLDPYSDEAVFLSNPILDARAMSMARKAMVGEKHESKESVNDE